MTKLITQLGASPARATATAFLFLASCAFSTSGTGGGEGTGESDLDVDAVLAAISDYASSGAFDVISVERYASEVAAGSDIRVWVSSEAAEDYATVDPEARGSGVTLPEGAIIVREVLSEDGALKSLTLMGKGPSGYNPDLGDWWFGVANPDGTLQVEDGEELIGRLDQCYGCHTPRADDDYLFGVPAAAKGGPRETGDPPPEEPGPVCGDFICDRPAGEDCRNCASDCFCAPDDDDDGDGGDDVTPPEFGGLDRVDEVSDDACELQFEPATDDVTPPDSILYDVFAGPRDEVELSTAIATLTRSQLALEGDVLVGTVSLPSGARHGLIVRARDEAGNSDDNTEEDDCDLR